MTELEAKELKDINNSRWAHKKKDFNSSKSQISYKTWGYFTSL